MARIMVNGIIREMTASETEAYHLEQDESSGENPTIEERIGAIEVVTDEIVDTLAIALGVTIDDE